MPRLFLMNMLVACWGWSLVSGFALSLDVTGETRLLRQPSLGTRQLVFVYASDLWVVDRGEKNARRLTSTSAVESDPAISPDGKWVAFSSNRSGATAVYLMSIRGGAPRRLTWYPSRDLVRGWTPDGKSVVYASTRETAPSGYERLWLVPAQGGPSRLLPAPFGHDGCFSPDGQKVIVEPVTRWDTEWRQYRGGQNRPLVILDPRSLEEIEIPCPRTADTQPLWLEEKIYFLSDRTGVVNLWSFEPQGKKLTQLTRFQGADIKSLSGVGNTLVFEREGWLHLWDLGTGKANRLSITVEGDFPWAEKKWEDVSSRIASSSLSATGKRALFAARGEIFSVPAEKGDTRNLSKSSSAADRMPVWSPRGDEVGWFSNQGQGYQLLISGQDGRSPERRYGLGESKMAWEATWSPDGHWIAFVDDDVRIRLIDTRNGNLRTLDTGGVNIERGSMGLIWSPDSRFLAYARTFANRFRRIVACPLEGGKPFPLTDRMADAFAPAWSSDGKYIFFLASTNLALRSGWANTSQMGAKPEYGAYMLILDDKTPTPFLPESDEEKPASIKDPDDVPGKKANDVPGSPGEMKEKKSGKKTAKKRGKRKQKDQKNQAAKKKDGPAGKKSATGKPSGKPGQSEGGEKSVGQVVISRDDLQRRVLALPLPVSDYALTLGGPADSVFIGERGSGSPGLTLHRFSLKGRKTSLFAKGISSPSVSSDRRKMLYRQGGKWSIVDATAPVAASKGALSVSLMMNLDRLAEWKQIFDEAWHYQRDFFYDPGLHGRNWNEVKKRYAPLLPYVRHRADLNYLLDQMNGELSVGHSFVSGGDLPSVPSSKSAVLGADLVADRGRWKLERIYTFESWNPTLKAPLDQPGLKVKEGDYLVGINGVPLTDQQDPYQWLEGTAGRQTVLHIHNKPDWKGSRTLTVEPISDESRLRRRAWVEDNRRRVDELSGGKLAYVWVPNTGSPGLASFDRYLFAQQDKLGAVIDERFNGGGLLDDYMVDLMTRKLRAAVTNEVPNGIPFRLPAGVLGPKVLLINERAGSGGDFFPWVFRQQKAGLLIGKRTWGGLVKSSTHYRFVDGGRMTAPDNAVFDPVNRRWIGENEGIPPDIDVTMDARSVQQGRDPQIERGVEELLKQIRKNPPRSILPPPFPRPAKIRSGISNAGKSLNGPAR
ncbi:MAG: PDZ domain-containing protein [Planctomycetota bacterium]|nr:PDZ domain-containing protein [Planctomycetota bacterium]